MLCSCRGSGKSGGLGFLPVSLCPCGVSVPNWWSSPHCLTLASFCAQQLLANKRIIPQNCMENALMVLCAFSKWATRGRGSTDGEERLERLKACEDGGERGVGWTAHVSDRENLIYLIRTEDVREFLWGYLWTATRSKEKENVCVCLCVCV